MAFVKKDRVRETTTSTGSGASIALNGAVAGYQSFGNAMSIGDTCWYAIVLPGSQWETGQGTYSALNTLTRNNVLENSIGSAPGGAGITLTAGTKDVFICQPASQAQPAFPAGTLMLFQQTAAPVYWTKQTTHNDKALRVVSGTASSGGSNTFSSSLNNTYTTANTTITTSTMPSHNHTSNASVYSPAFGVGTGAVDVSTNVGATINNNGGDGAHSHVLTFSVAYVDLIICSKD